MPKLDFMERPTALGVHIFAGGFSVGVRQAGFDVLAHLEDGPYGVSTAKLNWPDLDVRVGFDSWRLEDFAGRVDFLYSNPPCAIFSSAGISTTRGKDAWRQDPRLGCWHRAFAAFRAVRPKAFALESVTQAYTKGREVVDEFTMDAVSEGYSVKHVLMDAKWTGLPQSRKRFFFVAHEPHLDLKLSFDFDRRLTTVGDALNSMTSNSMLVQGHDRGANFAQWIGSTPPGGKLRNAYDAANVTPFSGSNCSEEDMAETPQGGYVGKKKGRPGFLYSRLHQDRQMGAFIGDVFAHPTENRFLSTDEMKALCQYPQDFTLDGPHRSHSSLLARAVMPPVGRWLATAVDVAIRGGKP